MARRNDLDFKLEIDNTLYYGTVLGKKTKKVKCAYCGKIHHYKTGEMIYQHNKYKFCSYKCRCEWRKKHPNAKPYNPFLLNTPKIR
jgi:hypothetical protein